MHRHLTRMAHGCLLIVLLLEPLRFVCGQSLPMVDPDKVGLSASRLERISSTVGLAIKDDRIAGAVTLVMRHGQVAWLKAQGFSDKDAGKPMPTDAIFRICSMTKPITSTAVMMLYEEGRFLLSDPVSKFIPEFKEPKVLVLPSDSAPYTIPAKREITIRDLLTHTSGLTYQWNKDLGPRYKAAGVTHGLIHDNRTIGDNVKILAGLPLLFQPGERFEYSLSIDVLGYLVEVVSGMPLNEFFRKRIFEPLQMNDTYFFLPDDKAKRLATAYTWYQGKGLGRFPAEPIVEGSFVYAADYPYGGPRSAFFGGAGLCSTASDYARFCLMILNNGAWGGTHLLGRKSVELMTHDQLGNRARETGFGIGFGVEGIKSPLQEVGSPGQFGWGGFFYTLFFIDPKEDMIGIFMAQLHPTGDLNLDRVFEALAYQAIAD
jgi:CubicO group peptidase (beta-lactamase class C family)